jgi:hypothetical protein
MGKLKMKRYQLLQIAASTNGSKLMNIEGVIITADTAMKILDYATVDQFFKMSMRKLCKEIQATC